VKRTDAALRGGPLRMGVLGCASIAWRRTIPAMLQTPKIRLIAVASREAGKAARFAGHFGCEALDDYETLLAREDIDAVYIPLPIGLHREWTGRALEAGKHVLVEKPLAATHAEAEEMTGIARRHGRRLLDNFMFLNHSQHEAIGKLVADGVIGQTRVFSSSFGIPPLPAADIRYSPQLAGGALLDVGVYPLRAAQLFLGTDLRVVGSVLRDDPATGVDVGGSALLRTPGGVTAEISFGMEHGYRCTYALWGSKGRISLDRAYTPPATWQPVVRVEQQDRVEELTLPTDHQFLNRLEAFADGVLGDADFTPMTDAMLSHAALVDEVRRQAIRIDA
jgi:dTDP-3,4-didehydro-2,6-dideoxy-alpha-D-glucose 3-reductase